MFRPSSGLSQEDQFNSISTFEINYLIHIKITLKIKFLEILLLSTAPVPCLVPWQIK